MKQRHRWPLDIDQDDYPDAAARDAALDKVGPCPRGMIWVNLLMLAVIVVVFVSVSYLFPNHSELTQMFIALPFGAIIQFRGERWNARRVADWLDQLDQAYKGLISQDPSHAH